MQEPLQEQKRDHYSDVEQHRDHGEQRKAVGDLKWQQHDPNENVGGESHAREPT